MNFVQESNIKKKGGGGRAKFKLGILEKTMLIEVKLSPLVREVTNNQGWWRVSTTLPFLGKNQRLTKNHGTIPLSPKSTCYCEQPSSSGVPSSSCFPSGTCSGNQVPLIPPTHVLASHHSSGSLYSHGWDSPHFLISLILLAFHGNAAPTYNHIIALLFPHPICFSFLSYYHSALII